MQNAFHIFQIPHSAFVDTVFDKAAAVKLVIRKISINTVHDEIHQTGQHIFAVLTLQESFQIVVAQSCIFDVDFTDNTNLDFSLLVIGKSANSCAIAFVSCLIVPKACALPLLKASLKRASHFAPVCRQRRVQPHRDVFYSSGTSGYRRKQRQPKLMHHGCIQMEAWLLLQTVDVEADNRDVRKACFSKALRSR